MESAPVENGQELEDESSQVIADPLQTPVILRAILQHFPNRELIKLSLVNKLWNHEARSVLRHRGNVTATMRSFRSCQNLRAFASDLRQMNVSPFSGITISLDGLNHFDTCEKSTGELDPLYHVVLNRLKWNHLAVNLTVSWKRCKSCPAFLLAKKVLQSYGGHLELASFQVGRDHEDFIQDVLRVCSFPCMKILKLGPMDNCGTAPTNLIQALISRTPKLEVFHTRAPVNLAENVLQGTSAVLVADFHIDLIRTEICGGIIPALRLTEMRLANFYENFSMERFLRVLPLLLQASHTTLMSMYIDAVFLVPLMCFGISLENVQKLTIFVNVHRLELMQPQVLRLVKDFDFTRIFPRLNRVHCALCTRGDAFLQDEMNEMVEQWNAAAFGPKPDRAVNVKSVSLPISPALEISGLRFLTEMLPDIEKLSVIGIDGQDIPFSIIWQPSWLNLREIVISKYGNSSPGNNVNLDSAFCGIFPEEVTELRERDEEYLRSVNIVPVMPSITCLKGLKSVRVLWRRDGSGGQVQDPTFTISKVTDLVAFERRPGLSVTLTTDD